jgi:hypothetical protein
MGHIEEGGVQVHEACRHRLRCAGYRPTVKTAVISPGELAELVILPQASCLFGLFGHCRTVNREGRFRQTPVKVSVFEIPHTLLIERRQGIVITAWHG